jgi:hypothetical protein
MRKIGGEALERLVGQADTLNARLALIPHIVAAAHAVAHAHGRGIIHRDIKPSNILCGDLGETIVIDWGLAKVKGEPDEDTGTTNWVMDHDSIKTRAGIVYGTPGFMAPEQLRHNVVNERTDVYALGATLYHLLSRKPPHHAKTADEMMRAAAKAPPVPLAELVQGVPPPLTTIVDKALSLDPKLRYQDAKALAEDLQRFLTGQLVASHHYTPRERLARFVRKNRVPVTAIGAALVALGVIGTIAVYRVIDERDRADAEAQRAREKERAALDAKRDADEQNDRLVLQQARSRVTTNPTEAVAMVKPLAKSHWREVRSIAAAASVNGVAWSLPGPQRAETLEMSRDGLRVLVAGGEGSVRIYDLAARSQQIVLPNGPRVHARFADGERKIVTWFGNQVRVIDLKAPAPRPEEFTVPSRIVDLEVVGVHAYWIDDKKKLWHCDLAARVPAEITVDEPLDQIAPSPDGRYIALIGESHLLLHDRTQASLPAQDLLFGKVRDFTWSEDGAHIAALVELGEATERQVADIDVAGGGQVVQRNRVGARQFVTWSRGRLFALGPSGVGVASRSEVTPFRNFIGDPITLRTSYQHVVIAGGQTGLAILTDDGDHPVPLPSGRLEIVEASPRSPYVVGAIEGRLLVWNLSEMLPRRLGARATVLEGLTGSNRVIAGYSDTTAEWIDLATGKARALPSLSSALLSATGTQDGRAACVVDATHHAMLIVDGKEPHDVGQADVCTFAGNQLILGTLGGKLSAIDIATRVKTPLVARAQKLVQATASRDGRWLAAAFGDGTLWRIDLTSNAQATTPAGGVPPMIAVQRDGTVIFPEGTKLQTWRPTGDIRLLAELVKPAVAIGIAGEDHVIAFTDRGLGFVIGLAAPNQVSDPFDPGSLKAAQAPDTGTVVFENRGAIEVMDPLANHRWILASSQGVTYALPQIAGDGRTIIARRVVADREKRELESRDPTVLLAWRFALPTTPDETAAWLDHLTNAAFDRRLSNVVWP